MSLKKNTLHIRLTDEQKQALVDIAAYYRAQSPLEPPSYSSVIRSLISAEYGRILDLKEIQK